MARVMPKEREKKRETMTRQDSLMSIQKYGVILTPSQQREREKAKAKKKGFRIPIFGRIIEVLGGKK